MAKRFASLGSGMEEALRDYVRDVRRGAFPGPENGFRMTDDEWKAFELSAAGQTALSVARDD